MAKEKNVSADALLRQLRSEAKAIRARLLNAEESVRRDKARLHDLTRLEQETLLLIQKAPEEPVNNLSMFVEE